MHVGLKRIVLAAGAPRRHAPILAGTSKLLPPPLYRTLAERYSAP